MVLIALIFFRYFNRDALVKNHIFIELIAKWQEDSKEIDKIIASRKARTITQHTYVHTTRIVS